MATDHDLDYLTMLLSVDWFFEYWWLIGLFAQSDERARLQQGLRPVVKQVVYGVEHYWLADFSPRRRAETARLFDVAVVRARPSLALVAGLEHLRLGGGGFLRRAPLEVWETLESIDLVGLSLASGSTWDQFVRSLTPDLPANLAHHVLAKLHGR